MPNPKPVAGNTSQSNSASSRYLYNGSFLRLKSARVGYTIPQHLLGDAGIDQLQVYFQGRNLWTHKFDDDYEFDPEVDNDGYTDLATAPLKSVTFGINLKF